MTPETDPFAYRPPSQAQLPHFDAVAKAIAAAYEALIVHVPDGPDRTLAVRKLQEARMWANCAIAFDGDSLKRA